MKKYDLTPSNQYGVKVRVFVKKQSDSLPNEKRWQESQALCKILIWQDVQLFQGDWDG